MKGETSNSPEQSLDGCENDNVTKSGFFQHFLAKFSSDASRKASIMQILCEDQRLLSHINFSPAYNVKDLNSIEISQALSYDNDNNMLLTQLRKGSQEGWTSIVLCGRKNAQKAAFDHFQLIEKPFSISSIQPSLASEGDLTGQLSELGKPWLIDQTVIGVQRHRDLSLLDDPLHQDLHMISLSQAMQNIAACEPDLRRSCLVNLDLDSVAHTSTGIGLSGQAISQLAHYAGRSSSCEIMVITGVNDSKDPSDLLLPVIWYFMYGKQFVVEPIAKMMKTYFVDQETASYTFLSDERTQKWWLKNEFSSSLQDAFPLLACSYEDYSHMINHNELSPYLQYLKDLFEAYRIPQQ